MTRADLAFWVAAGAAAAAAVLALLLLILYLRVRRLLRNQRRVLSGSEQDLVEYAVGLLARVERVEARASAVEGGLSALARRLDGCIQRRGLVRYDALEGAGAKQSSSIALLDASGSGFVISAIQARDYARIYVKDIDSGEGDLELSPEERRALQEAAASGR